AGVLERVREGLLDDPVRGEVDGRWEIVALALDGELDLEARGTDRRCEALELGDPRLRRKRRVVVVLAEHAEQAAHLDERLTARALDLLERGRRRVIALRARSAGLEHDDAEVVRDDVVQ